MTEGGNVLRILQLRCHYGRVEMFLVDLGVVQQCGAHLEVRLQHRSQGRQFGNAISNDKDVHVRPINAKVST